MTLINTENIFEQSVNFAKLLKPELMTTDDGMEVDSNVLEIHEKKPTRIYTNYCEAAVVLKIVETLLKVIFLTLPKLISCNFFLFMFNLSLELKGHRLALLHRILPR